MCSGRFRRWRTLHLRGFNLDRQERKREAFRQVAVYCTFLIKWMASVSGIEIQLETVYVSHYRRASYPEKHHGHMKCSL